MTYPYSRKPSRTTTPAPSRIGVAVRSRSLLDLHLGAALWKDRRVSPAIKLLALAVGVLVIASLVGLDCLLARWMAGPLALGQLSLSSLALAGGSVLFGTIALLRLAPESVVNILRLERGGAIPLRRNRN